jgi:hypothetical protein
MQGSLSVERMCQLAEISRASFYRSLQEGQPVEEEMEVIGDSADCVGTSAPVWLPKDFCGAATPRDASQSQAGSADHAGG